MTKIPFSGLNSTDGVPIANGIWPGSSSNVNLHATRPLPAGFVSNSASDIPEPWASTSHLLMMQTISVCPKCHKHRPAFCPHKCLTISCLPLHVRSCADMTTPSGIPPSSLIPLTSSSPSPLPRLPFSLPHTHPAPHTHTVTKASVHPHRHTLGASTCTFSKAQK